MGLLDTTGKEVIPCQYDAVGLPVEGISRVIKKSGNKYYLGYWSIKKGKEIVKPNKYVVSGTDATSAGTVQIYMPLDRTEEITQIEDVVNYYKKQTINRLAVQYDFNGGYALVPTGKIEVVNHATVGNVYRNLSKTTAYLIYAQIIDTNGKEILAGGPYPYRDNGIYPQSGPYMVYQKLSKEKLSVKTGGSSITFKTHLEAGVVGKKGVVIKAQYHGGIRGSAATGWFPADANLQIISEYSLVLTAKDVYKGQKEDSARTGVVNLKNKTVIPFEHGYDRGLTYNSEYKIFQGGKYLYKPDGKKIPNSNLASYNMNGSVIISNGYFLLWDNVGNYGYKGVASIKTGKTYTNKNLYSPFNDLWWLYRSYVSTDGTLWIRKQVDKKGEWKWGLVNLQGKVILPFEYDDVRHDGIWERAKNGYAIVEKNGYSGFVDTKGKEILPCKYWGFNEIGDYFIVREKDSGKYGLFYRTTGKMVIPCTKERISDEWINGTFVVTQGPSLNVLMDIKGNVLTDGYLSIVAASDCPGLFANANRDYVGPDGKIVFPRSETYALINGNNVFYGEDLSLVVKDGKVGYIRTSRLAREGQELPATPYVKPDASPKNAQLKYYLIKYPSKLVYKIGEPFEISGFIAHSEDTNGARKVLDNSKISFMVSGSVKVTDGYKFTEAGTKVMECYYDGVKTGFSIQATVLDTASTGDLLDNGTYTIGVYGKYLRIVNGYIELWDTKPADKFTVKLVNYDKDKGPMYYIMTEGGQYLAQGSSKDGDQLIVSNVPHAWRINKYSNFCTIRDYGKQKLVVNASGKKSSNGTKIIVWSHTGSAPENAKLTFTLVK